MGRNVDMQNKSATTWECAKEWEVCMVSNTTLVLHHIATNPAMLHEYMYQLDIILVTIRVFS